MRASPLGRSSPILRVFSLSILASAVACAEAPSEGSSAPVSPGGAALDLDLTLDDATTERRIEACASGVAETVPLPPVVQMVVDTSASMAWPPGWEPDSKEPPADCDSKWDITRGALTTALGELSSATLLGVNFYPNVENGAESCVRNEIAIPMAALGDEGSEQRKRLSAELAAVRPRGGTPTHAAYRFGLETLERRRLWGNGFVVLITDGAPNFTASCAGGREPVDSAPLVAEAARALDRGVRTYVIGSPGSEPARSALSRMAIAGGTGADDCSHDGPRYCHFDMTGAADLGRSLEAALSRVSEALTRCEYGIPQAPAGMAFASDLVNVLYTPRNGSPELLSVNEAGGCTDGWAYSADGRRIVLCEETCRAAQREPGTRLEVVFGCQSAWRTPR